LPTLLTIAAEQDLEISQFDVKTAFLYGQLEEEIYMKILEGLQTSSVSGEEKMRVCKLLKVLYGLKQASRCWNEKFKTFLKKFRFSECESDKCVFKGCIDNCMILLALYVDDGLIFAKSKKAINAVNNALREIFQITIGNASVFVGMQIERDRVNKTMSIHQREYIDKIIAKFNMAGANSVSIPIHSGHDINVKSFKRIIKCAVPRGYWQSKFSRNS